MKNNIKKWLALFLCAVMVLTSGIFTMSGSLKASDENEFASAENQTTENTDYNVGEAAEGEQDVTGADTQAAGGQTDAPAAEDKTSLTPVQETTGEATPAAAEEEKKSEEEESEEKKAETTASSSSEETSSNSEEEDEKADRETYEDSFTYDQTTYGPVSDDGQTVSVTAELSDANAVPDQAELKVTPITSGDAYDAYLAALNENAGEEDVYTSENTILYDVAFLLQKFDDEGKAVDGEKVETEPASPVNVKFNFTDNQLTDGLGVEDDSQVEVSHLTLSDEAKETQKEDGKVTADNNDITADQIHVQDVQDLNVSSDQVSLKTDSFSVFSVTNLAPDKKAKVVVKFKDENGNPLSGVNLGKTYDGENQVDSQYYVKIGGEFDGYGNQYFVVPLTLNNSGSSAEAVISGFDHGGKTISLKEGKEYSLHVYAKKQNFGQTVNLDANINDNDFYEVKSGDIIAGGYRLEVPDSFKYSVESPKLEMTAQKISTSADYNYGSILGNALYYAIVANKLEQGNDLQTNFAVNTFENLVDHADSLNLSGQHAGAIIAGKIVGNNDLRIGNKTSGDVTVYTSTPKKVKDESSYAVSTVESNYDAISANVNAMISYVDQQSAAMAGRSNTFALPDEGNTDKYVIDTTNLNPNATIYLDADKISSYIARTDALRINKKPGQTIVFNFDSTSELTIGKFRVNGTDSSTSTEAGDTNSKLDGVARGIVWNITKASSVKLDNTTGIFIVNAAADVTIGTTSSGWIVARQKVYNQNGEWHGIFQEMPETHPDEATLRAAKKVEGKVPSAGQNFTFSLYQYNKDTKDFDTEAIDTAENKGGDISFDPIPFSSDTDLGDNIYKIVETDPGTGYRAEKDTFYACVKVTKTQDADSNSTYAASLPTYYQDFDATNGTLSNPIEGNTVVFNNTKDTYSATGTLTLTAKKELKDSNGQIVTLAGNDFSFGVYENNTEIASAGNAANGTITFPTIPYTLKDVGNQKGGTATKTYTIKEINDGKENITYDETSYTVTVDLRDDEKGHIVATPHYPETGDIVFHNTQNLPETVDVSGTKTWDDGENEDGIRPQEIIVRLFADGVEKEHKEVTAADGWKYSFTQLPKYAGEGGGRHKINYTISEDTVTGYKTTYSGNNGYNIKNSYNPREVNVSVTKTWDDSENQDGIRPDRIDVRLLVNGKADDRYPVVTLTDGNWSYTWENLPEKSHGTTINYSVEEVSVPTGYTSKVSTVNGNDHSFVITNTHTPKTIDIEGQKTWKGDDNDRYHTRPASITIHLCKNGTTVQTVTTTAEKGWKYKFTGLPEKENGQAIPYTVYEEEVPGYKAKVTGYNIENTYSADKVSVSAEKVWNDANNADGIRPESVQVQLVAGDELVDKPVTLSSANQWKYTWPNLPKMSGNAEISYSVREVGTPKGYSASVTVAEDNKYVFTVTNTHSQATVDINGTKHWEDKEDQDGKRPQSVTVYLDADGKQVDYKTVTSDDNWTYSFTGLPKNAGGKEIAYTVREEPVTDYQSSINGYDITNSYTPGKTSYSVEKIWDDNQNQDGVRPTSITVQLYAGDQAVGIPVTLSAKAGWSYTWSDLDKYQNKKKIEYSVKELKNGQPLDAGAAYDNNYKVGYSNSTETGKTIITNSHMPETTELNGVKRWVDDDNRDGLRPESITVRAMNGSETVATQVVQRGADGNWTYSFKGLPAKKNGVKINYTVVEDIPNGYTNVADASGITNTHSAETTEYTVQKIWDDKENQDGKRPESIRVQLYADGQAAGEAVTLTDNPQDASKAWTYTWKDLPKKANGADIVYSVKELDADGKAVEADAAADAYYTAGYAPEAGRTVITNTHQAETVTISGTKTWVDNADKRGTRPGSITVTLKNNVNDDVRSTVVTADADGKWTYTFENLPKYANGKEIQYTVDENPVEGYSKDIDGYNITNTYTPGKVQHSVIKVWNDGNNADGTRPAEIKVQLYADGEKSGDPVTLSGTTEHPWSYTWDELDKTDKDGNDIVYTVKEIDGNGKVLELGDAYNSDYTVGYQTADGTTTITNTHVAAAKAVLSGTKILQGGDISDYAGRFRFDLIDNATGNRIDTAKNDATGAFAFKQLTFDKAGTYQYTIREQNAGQKIDNIQYSGADVPATVTVTDAGGKLEAAVSYGGYAGAAFTNVVQTEETRTVDLVANKTLVGGTLEAGQFTFEAVRNSDPGTVVKTAVNASNGQIYFTDIPYDAEGYTVREVAGSDQHVTYDDGTISYNEAGEIIGEKKEFTNTYKPTILRVQKTSKEEPHDPLVHATYGLYQVVPGGNDILVESEVSDENGYMYYTNFEEGVVYYFKEIAAPEGHEVDPYPGPKFMIKYVDGRPVTCDENGAEISLGDITEQDASKSYVQTTGEASNLDAIQASSGEIRYANTLDNGIKAVAIAAKGALPDGAVLEVSQTTLDKAEENGLEKTVGKVNPVVYYKVSFVSDGVEVEPAVGDVTVTIQNDGGVSLDGTKAGNLKIVHLKGDGTTSVEPVTGSIAATGDKLLQTSFTADSFSVFGVVEPTDNSTFGENFLLTSAGVSDQVSELNIAKLDTTGKYVIGAELQIIERATGAVKADWKTNEGPKSFARWFNDAKTDPMNVDTEYVLHEVSAPDGYQLADDIVFTINKYDSSITVYKYDDSGKLVVDQEAVDKWVSDTTLDMIDVPVKFNKTVKTVQKVVPNYKTIQGGDKVITVQNIKAVQTGDNTPIAALVIVILAAAAVLAALFVRKRRAD